MPCRASIPVTGRPTPRCSQEQGPPWAPRGVQGTGPVRKDVLLRPIVSKPQGPLSLLSDTPSGRTAGTLGVHVEVHTMISRVTTKLGVDSCAPESPCLNQSSALLLARVSSSSWPRGFETLSVETGSGDLRRRPDITHAQTCCQMFTWGECEARSPDRNKGPWGTRCTVATKSHEQRGDHRPDDVAATGGRPSRCFRHLLNRSSSCCHLHPPWSPCRH